MRGAATRLFRGILIAPFPFHDAGQQIGLNPKYFGTFKGVDVTDLTSVRNESKFTFAGLNHEKIARRSFGQELAVYVNLGRRKGIDPYETRLGLRQDRSDESDYDDKAHRKTRREPMASNHLTDFADNEQSLAKSTLNGRCYSVQTTVEPCPSHSPLAPMRSNGLRNLSHVVTLFRWCWQRSARMSRTDGAVCV